MLNQEDPKALIQSDIENFMNSMIPDQNLTLSKLHAIAVNGGADYAVITTPSADVDPASDEILRPGTITVTAG